MLHLVHLPSGRVINVGDSLEDGIVRVTNAGGTHVPYVRVVDGRGTMYYLSKGDRFLDYEVIGD